MNDGWDIVLQAAACVIPPDAWRFSLASALRSAANASGALVMTAGPRGRPFAHVASLPEGVLAPARVWSRVMKSGGDDTDDECVAGLYGTDNVLLGALAVRFGPNSDREECSRALHDVAPVAAFTLQTAVDLAASCRVDPTSELLSSREQEIAGLACTGLSDLNIASRLHISEATVGTHMHRIYRKLGIHSRVDLARLMGGL